MRRSPINPPQLPPPRGFSQSIQCGDLIILSVQLPFTAEGNLVSAEFRAQCAQVFENVRTVLEYQGATLNDLLKTNIYLTSMGNYDAFREIRADTLTPPFPTSTLVGIKRLAYEGVLVAIRGLAAANPSKHERALNRFP